MALSLLASYLFSVWLFPLQGRLELTLKPPGPGAKRLPPFLKLILSAFLLILIQEGPWKYDPMAPKKVKKWKRKLFNLK